MSRALPLLMLTVVVYFTGELWQLSARMTRQRLWETVGFLALVALVFMVTTIRDEVQALRDDRAEQTDAGRLLVDTPFTESASTRTPLSRAEQINVVAVMVVSQAIQVVLFTAGLFAFFLALGIIAIPYDVTVLWAANRAVRSANRPVREPGSAYTSPYRRQWCTPRCSSPCCPGSTSPSAPASIPCTGSASSIR